MDNKNNIQLIDQRIAHLCTLIPKCSAQSTAAEKRLANTIITLEIKRIEAIHALEKRLGELRVLIPVYKARCPTYEHVLAKQIINLDLQLIAAKTNQFLTHPPEPHQFAPHPPEAHSPAPHPPATNLPRPQPLQSNDMAEVLTKRPRQVPNFYWQPGQPIGIPVSNFRQIKYLPIPNAAPDLDQALSGARLDCGRDLHKQLIEFGVAAKVWMTVQVEYEPVNLMANKQRVEQYLIAAPTRMFKRDVTVSAFANPYNDSVRIFTDRTREFNAKFIRDRSGLRLVSVLQFTLKIMKYVPLEGRGWQPLPEFLAKKEVIINIRNNDERCFVYSLLYFLERDNLPERNGNCVRKTLYKEEMFQRRHLDTLPYPISPNDVYLYEDRPKMNINVFLFFEGRARHPLVISRKSHERVVNLLYWKKHYAPITSIPRLFADITKHNPQKHFCLRCLGHFTSEEVLARHKQLCTRDDFMSVLHVLPVPVSKQAQIKFNQYEYCTKAPFVIYADFESILEPSCRQVKHTTYTQHHKVCAAAAILTSSFYNFDQRTVMKIGENALAEFCDSLIV